MRTIQQFFEDSKKGLQRFMTQFEPGEDGEGGVINYFKQNLQKYQYDEDGNVLKIYLNRHKDKYITTDEIKQLYEIAEDGKILYEFHQLTKQEKKQLYESIMRDVAKIVKKAIEQNDK